MKAPVFGLLALSILIGACSKQEELKVLEAMQEFPIYEMNVGKALLAKQKMLESKGIKTELVWSFQARKIEEEEIEHPVEMIVTAELNFPEKKNKKETYKWRLIKNKAKSMAKRGTVWDMKPENKTARSFMKIKKSRLAKWASFLIPKSSLKISKKKTTD